ncbi:MAG: phospholipid carrier-dependent glycosyltransferase [Candidatus Sulfotelmatobacter sp.]
MSTEMPLEAGSAPARGRGDRLAPLLIVSAGVNWCFQVIWFWRYCGRNINADAVSYIGIARHFAAGDFRASVHGYWSPLISWLIAATSLAGNDRSLSDHGVNVHTMAARLLMLPLFALCLALAYWLTYRLWGSRLLGAMVVLWFTAARGVAAFSVCFIGADFLLTACVLTYFILLLRCLQQPESLGKWLVLGLAHGVAFLAKAISLPLFAIATLLAVLSSLRGNSKKAAVALVCAAIFPVLSAAGWGTAIRAKYHVFTTGYQLRFNLLAPAARRASQPAGLAVLHDARMSYDDFMVTDQMPPGSPIWRAQVWRPGLARQILRKEAQNIPQAIKELFVLLTPGGILAVCIGTIQLTRGRKQAPGRFRFAWIVLFTTAALVLAYCMLVFDGRYVLPIAAVLMALGIRFAVPPGMAGEASSDGEKVDDAGRWQTFAGIVLVIGLIGTQLYWASPFRTMRQDFQRSLYDAADGLRKGQARTVVVVGEGPYPEHGVGWEAGVYTAYFAGARVVGDLFEDTGDAESGAAPRGTVDAHSVVSDVGKLAPDAVLVWDSPAHAKYASVVSSLRQAYPDASTSSISDPVKGNVGTLILFKRRT